MKEEEYQRYSKIYENNVTNCRSTLRVARDFLPLLYTHRTLYKDKYSASFKHFAVLL